MTDRSLMRVNITLRLVNYGVFFIEVIKKRLSGEWRIRGEFKLNE